MPSPSGISEISLLSITWPIVARPVSRIGPLGDDADLFRDAARFERDVVLHLVTDADQDVLVDAGPEAVERRGDR